MPPPSQISRPVVPATAQQIAELNSLLATFEAEVHRNNGMLTSFIWSGCFSVWGAFLDKLADGQKESAIRKCLTAAIELFSDAMGLDSKSESVTFPIILALFCMVLFSCKKLWDVINKSLYYFFPNGVMTFNREKHRAFSLQHQLLSSNDATDMIKQLKELKGKIEQKNRYIVWYSLAASLLVPIPGFFRYNDDKTTLSIIPSPLGVHFTQVGLCVGWTEQPGSSNKIMQAVSSAVNTQQSLYWNTLLWKLWCNWNLPKQYKAFFEQLKDFSFCTQWSYRPEIDDPYKTIFSLELGANEKVSLKIDKDNKNIDSEHYIAELYRTCLDFNLPIYSVTDSTKLYLAFSNIFSYTANNIKNKLKLRLENVIKLEAAIEHNLSALDSIDERGEWDYYSSVNEKGSYEVMYFCDTRRIPHHLRDDYLHTIQQACGKQYIKKQNLMASVALLDKINIAEFSAPRAAYQSSHLSEATPTPHADAEFTVVESSRSRALRKKGADANSPEEKTDDTRPSATQLKNALLRFHQGYFFDAKKVATEEDRLAYPLSVSWLPEGTFAFAAADPAIFQGLVQYVAKDDIIEHLRTGIVMGSRKTRKTKAGATGIKTCTDGYKNVHGRNIPAANFKMKFTNNIRIYGRRVQEVTISGQKHILYVFDGYGYGH